MPINVKHGSLIGGKRTPEYSSWESMKGRCLNPRSPSYPKYGGRGITVCDRWVSSFENFLADMGKRPSLSHSLERMDNLKGYDPDNCRWATRTEQQNNRRVNARLTCNGETLTLAQWVKRSGINRDTLNGRLRRGWPIEKALGVPPDQRNRNRRTSSTQSR